MTLKLALFTQLKILGPKEGIDPVEWHNSSLGPDKDNKKVNNLWRYLHVSNLSVHEVHPLSTFTRNLPIM
jgi:hypothetical protein